MIRSIMKFMALLACALLAPLAFGQYNISFVGQLDYQDLRNSNLSNLWGYTDETGVEYAIVGVNGGDGSDGGVSIVDLSDPADPQEIFFAPGPNSIWREVKVWNDHAYITTEAEEGGVTIIDMSPLPESTALQSTVFIAEEWDNAHSLFIDENGRLYIFGANRGEGGAIMYDLTVDPLIPIEVGEFDTWYVHDGFARGDTLYAAHIYDGFFSIVDVSDPADPILLGTQTTPNLFTHNVWLDDSGDHIYTTDEKNNAFVGSYDVSDPTDIQFLDQLQSDAGSDAVPHNTYWLNDYLVTSYYTYGVTIYDATYPHNLIEVGHFDTTPLEGPGFDGAWGVYPFFGSERLIISDIQLGLFVLDPTYIRGAYLEGTITNANTNAPIGQATVTIIGPTITDISALDGSYATGYHQAGTYTVTVFAPGYELATIEGVVLDNGIVTVLDVALVPLPSFALQGTVIDAFTGEPIAGAEVDIRNAFFWFNAEADANGNFVISSMFEDDYTITAGKWGWITHCPGIQSISASSGALNIALQRGYYDDMELDLGWEVMSTASDGSWVREEPVETNYQGETSNAGADVADDCGGKAMITGNAGGGAGDDDVDEGMTSLTSPIFDVSGMTDAHVNYYRWFFNSGGSDEPNDELIISLDNGEETVVVETITNSETSNSWQLADIRIEDFLQPTSTMRFIVLAEDDQPGHLVEAGLDLFRVIDAATIGIGTQADLAGSHIWPNPSNGTFVITATDEADRSIEIQDALGRIVMAARRMQNGRLELDLDLAPGTYLVRSINDHGSQLVKRIVIH
ncbi:MAG: choice-of-anchor B family protein [Bacteroidota bacterium]|nr:choice-of-anchor B family protein [Bacteroidota bacterium]